MKRSVYLILFLIASLGMRAQIGYQVSLLNSATGEPRANETVSVTVAITNSLNEQIFSSTQSATTNDFGVLSLQIGNSTTFDNVDWSKLPLFISATVDGVMVGKSQILNVPVAEAAKQLVGVPLDSICRTWTGEILSPVGDLLEYNLNLNINNTGSLTIVKTRYYDGVQSTMFFNIPYFYIVGESIYLWVIDSTYDAYHELLLANYHNGALMVSSFGSISWGACVLH